MKSVTGLKNARMWVALCDNTFRSKLVFAHIWSLRHRAWGLVLICKAVLEPSRRTQRGTLLKQGRRESVTHRWGRDIILYGRGWHLISKHNSDQQLYSSADCRQTRYTGLQHLFTGAQKSFLSWLLFFQTVLHSSAWVLVTG